MAVPTRLDRARAGAILPRFESLPVVRAHVFLANVQVGQYRAVLTLDDHGAFRATWSPRSPSYLTADELAQYLDCRNKLVGEMRSALARNNSLTVPYARSEWVDDA